MVNYISYLRIAMRLTSVISMTFFKNQKLEFMTCDVQNWCKFSKAEILQARFSLIMTIKLEISNQI